MVLVAIDAASVKKKMKKTYLLSQHIHIDMQRLVVFEGPVLGPQKDQGPDRTGPI